MRYSVLKFVDMVEYVTPTSIIGTGRGNDISLSHGNLDDYTLRAIDDDGVRWYTQTNIRYYNMLLIPEPHQCFNGGVLISNVDQDEHDDYYIVTDYLTELYERVRKSSYNTSSKNV